MEEAGRGLKSNCCNPFKSTAVSVWSMVGVNVLTATVVDLGIMVLVAGSRTF